MRTWWIVLAAGISTMGCSSEEPERPAGPSPDSTCAPLIGSPDLYDSCSCCNAEEVCRTVNAGTAFYACDPRVMLQPGQFECGNRACDEGTICERRDPVTDGSTS